VIANFELAKSLVTAGLLDAAKTPAGMNKGGTASPLGAGIKIHMVPASHTSSVDMAEFNLPEWKGPRLLDGGSPVGYVIEFENGFKIYHTGDTDVFGDMALIGRRFKPDLALVCIGGYFTMDPEGAALAMREYIKPKQVIPMHYGTFPVINRTPAEFKAALGNSSIKMIDVKPGEAVRF
jgi:L-ascorbate metabolism protein UlaG (beta-lactamase superfamily)